MRICPKCSYHDGVHWRASTFDPTKDICRLEDLPRILQNKISKLTSRGVLEVDIYSYRLSKGDWVQRKETEFLKVEGWHVLYDGQGSRKSAVYKWRVRNPERYRTYQRDLMRKRRRLGNN